MSEVYESFLEFALELANQAAEEIIPRYHNHTVSYKDDGSVVTEADRQAELRMRQVITDHYPDHGILGEEFGEKETDGPFRWVLDPVDGTAWFVLGVPVFGTLIALTKNDEPVVGVIHFPALGETFYAATGSGCWHKIGDQPPRRLTVQPVSSLVEAYASASGIHHSDVRPAEGGPNYSLTNLIRSTQNFRFCTDCMQYTLVCRGRLQIGLDTIMNPWDIAAIVPCVEEAGGVVSNLQGQRNGIINGGSLIAAANTDLLTAAIDLLRS